MVRSSFNSNFSQELVTPDPVQVPVTVESEQHNDPAS